MRLLIAVLFLLGLAAGASAQHRAFKQCRVVNGQVFSCEGAWYQGTAALYVNR